MKEPTNKGRRLEATRKSQGQRGIYTPRQLRKRRAGLHVRLWRNLLINKKGISYTQIPFLLLTPESHYFKPPNTVGHMQSPNLCKVVGFLINEMTLEHIVWAVSDGLRRKTMMEYRQFTKAVKLKVIS